MFRGNHPTRVDEKGRLKLPAKFNALLEGDGEAKQVFYITSKDGRRAQLYPMKIWEQLERDLENVSDLDPNKQMFLDVTSYYGQEVEMDQQGRLLIPQVLRDAAQLTGDVLVFGKQTILEVLNRESYEAELKSAPMTVDQQARLAELIKHAK